MADLLICSACGFSNEPERLYCHSCGAKLDRSLLPVPDQDRKQEFTEAARRRIQKMTNPSRFNAGRFLKSLLATLFWAAIFAAVFLIARKPDGVPEDKNDTLTRLLQSELLEAIQSPSPRAISFSEADINGALKQSLKRAGGGGGVPGIEFQRGFAKLTPGVIRIGAQQSLWGYPIYSGVDYKLMIIDGKFTPILIGGNFGRLPVHLEVMRYLDFAFQKLWGALQRERTQMESMQSVTIREGQIVFVTKGAGVR